ncbi:hypothetical protein HZH66_001369 [Vespula vulgaris]|uniref:Uncharacterized protein n=1 Tax=Vespula vulgaris TaxID=7454 RepID=A0A834NLP4_VESVU|nr:hypothetical protein HZH66_001369 [Vespula vulgaris]
MPPSSRALLSPVLLLIFAGSIGAFNSRQGDKAKANDSMLVFRTNTERTDVSLLSEENANTCKVSGKTVTRYGHRVREIVHSREFRNAPDKLFEDLRDLVMTLSATTLNRKLRQIYGNLREYENRTVILGPCISR